MGLMQMNFARVMIFLCGMASAGVLAGTVTHYHNDLAGSPVVATNASGQVIWRESYRPFGERLTIAPASANNDVWFTSRRQDVDTGLVYMGARYYDPVLGRFLSKDPVGFTEANIHSFNRYAYANNNPYRFVDPNGRYAWELALGGVALFLILEPPEMQRAQAKSLGQLIGRVRGMFQEQADDPEAKPDDGDSATGVDGTGEGKSRNKPPAPLPEAEGRPHSIIEEPGKDGQYTTHNGDGTSKQYRGSGKDHGGIPRPNVKEIGKNFAPDGREFIDKGRVRPARPNETPGG